MRTAAILLLLLAVHTPGNVVANDAPLAVAGQWEGYIDSAVLVRVEYETENDQLVGTASVPAVPQTSALREIELVPGFLGRTRVKAVLSSAAWGDCKLDLGVRGNAMTGWIHIRGRLYLVDLSRTPPAAPAAAPAPWVPNEPVPYRAEEVEFRSGNIKLAGEITVPVGAGPHPAVVLLSGGVADDRDGNDFVGQGNVFYRVIADHLSRRGIVVLRMDDRGIGGSGGNYQATTLEGLAGDAAAAAEFLATRPSVRTDRVGLLGVSEGAVIAPLASLRTPAVSFLALLAPEAVVGATGELARAERRLREADGDLFAVRDLREDLELRKQILAPMLEGVEPAAIRRRLLDAGQFKPRTIDVLLELLTNPHTASACRHDAGATLARVSAPVLAIYFGRDGIVPPSLNEPALRAAFAEGGNQDVTIRRFESLDHQMREADAESVTALPRPPLLPAATVLDCVSDWIDERLRR